MKLDTRVTETLDIVSTCLKCTACAYSGWPPNTIQSARVFSGWTFKGSLAVWSMLSKP
jgi:hypothetical protein